MSAEEMAESWGNGVFGVLLILFYFALPFCESFVAFFAFLRALRIRRQSMYIK